MKCCVPSLFLVPLLALSGLVFGQEPSVLSLKSQIPLPNVNGRIDHMSVDVKGRRLFVAAVENHTLEVIDLKSGQRVHTIAELAEPQGVFYDASTNRVFVACGTDGATKIFDGTTFQVLATVKFPDDADNIRYDARGKRAIVVGGSGLYVKALTHGLSSAPSADPDLRAQLNELSLDDLQKKLRGLDRTAAKKIDMKNRRRLVRAIEICLLGGKQVSERREWSHDIATHGVFVFRDRDDLYQRINRRVEAMFEAGVIEQVRAAGAMSATAAKMIGLREIRDLLDGKMSILQCIAAIQQATRRYAKRQLTWFRRQTNFQSLNLSVLSHVESVERISQFAKTLGVAQGND